MAQNPFIMTIGDIMNWEGVSERTAQRRMKAIRDDLLSGVICPKLRRHLITIAEYCEYYAYNTDEVFNFLRS